MLDRLVNIPEIQRIIINTDAREKLVSFGLLDCEKVIIRDREQHLCGHDVSMNLIIQDDLDHVVADTFLMTHATNPLLEVSTIRQALKSYKNALNNGFDSLFTVNRFQTRFYDIQAQPINHDPNELLKTQDLAPWFEENSNLYIFSKESFYTTRSRIGSRPFLFETAKYESVDIDNPSDWEFAEMAMKFALEGNQKL